MVPFGSPWYNVKVTEPVGVFPVPLTVAKSLADSPLTDGVVDRLAVGGVDGGVDGGPGGANDTVKVSAFSSSVVLGSVTLAVSESPELPGT